MAEERIVSFGNVHQQRPYRKLRQNCRQAGDVVTVWMCRNDQVDAIGVVVAV
ncbi:hypothetical protein W823_14500 [Williamsia sp. D3]|nr:hypothetical protein W823_14500 [Williamsia sp. D3]